jgi:hypothetical protein
MHGAIPPLLHASSWRGALLSSGTTLPLEFHNLCWYACLHNLMQIALANYLHRITGHVRVSLIYGKTVNCQLKII